MNTTRCLALCAAVLAAGCGDPKVAPMDLHLGAPLHSREVPLKLSRLSYEYPSIEECIRSPRLFQPCTEEFVLCDNGMFTIAFSDAISIGMYTLSGDSLHATLRGGTEFVGILAADGSFISAQLLERPFQNYARSAAEQKSLEAHCKFFTDDW